MASGNVMTYTVWSGLLALGWLAIIGVVGWQHYNGRRAAPDDGDD